MNTRQLRDEERTLIRSLAPKGATSDLGGARVQDIHDGGMGSIRFARDGTHRRANAIAEAQYADTDGVLVTIELNADEGGQLFELDFWKVDFSPLQQYPTSGDLRLVKRY